jgi:hypothetical protein
VAFDGIGLDEIWSMTALLNEPSQAVMRRLGLTEVARFSHPRVPAGHPLQPHVTYHRPRPTAPALVRIAATAARKRQPRAGQLRNPPDQREKPAASSMRRPASARQRGLLPSGSMRTFNH